MKRIAFFFIAVFLFGDSYVYADQSTVLEARLLTLFSRFPMADLNRDGVLTIDEYRQFKSNQPTGSQFSASTSAETTSDSISMRTATRPSKDCTR